MDRRTALRRLGAGAVAGLAGCLTPPSASSPSSPGPDDLQRRVSIVEEDAVPDEHRLRLEATVLEPAVTDSHPARIRVTLTNEGPPRGVHVSTRRCALFNRGGQASHPRGHWLAHADDPIYDEQLGPRWVAAPPENGTFPDYGCPDRRYATGESVRNEHHVLDDARLGGYLKAGTYLFEEDVALAPSAEAGDDAPRTFTWGFTVRVENPHCVLCL